MGENSIENISTIYNFNLSENLGHLNIEDDNDFTGLLNIFLPIYLRVGFILIQIGRTPTTNTSYIILQNIIDFSVATASYFLIGYRFAFGNDFRGLGLIGSFFVTCMDIISMNTLMYGWAAIMITTGIITTMFAGRMHIIGYILLSFLTAGFLQPMFMHWLWDNRGVLRYNNLYKYHVSLLDNCGVSNIHICGGIIAFVGNLCFGRKVIKLKDLDRDYLASATLTVVGYLLVISGIITTIPPLEISLFEDNHFMVFVRNNIVALSGGIIGAAFLMKITKSISVSEEYLIVTCMQGGLMGVVTVSGGLFVYSPILSFIFGAMSSILLVILSRILLRSAFDDYCNIVPIHLVGGFIGLILPTTCICKNFLTKRSFFMQILWQVIGFLSIVIAALPFILTLLFLLKHYGLLKNKTDDIHHKLSTSTIEQIPLQEFLKRFCKTPQNKCQDGDRHVGKNNDPSPCKIFVSTNLETSQFLKKV